MQSRRRDISALCILADVAGVWAASPRRFSRMLTRNSKLGDRRDPAALDALYAMAARLHGRGA